VTFRESLPLNRNYVKSRLWKPALEAVGVPATRDNGSDSLRQFYASGHLSAGESIKAVPTYLGHTNAGFTLSTFTHHTTRPVAYVPLVKTAEMGIFEPNS
jgi:integrase